MTGEPTQAPANPQSPPAHAERYEGLRVYGVERRTAASRDGLVVLLRQGVAAWMEARSRQSGPPPRPAQVDPQRQLHLPKDVRAEVVGVLAAMTLSHIQEVNA